MSRLEIVLSAILFFSIALNIGLILYVRGAIIRLLYVSEELGDLQEMINSFSQHLKIVYELDSFYGDETLRALLHHAISLNEQMETFEIIYSLTEDDKKQGNQTEDDRTEEEEEEEEDG